MVTFPSLPASTPLRIDVYSFQLKWTKPLFHPQLGFFPAAKARHSFTTEPQYSRHQDNGQFFFTVRFFLYNTERVPITPSGL